MRDAVTNTLLRRVASTSRRRRGVLLTAVVAVIVVTVVVVVLLLGGGDSPSDDAQSASVAVDVTPLPGLPAGATACPTVYRDLSYRLGARGTPMTSCGFVEQTRLAYDRRPAASGPQQMRVTSPSTGKWYDLVCSNTGTYVTCSGAVGAVIYLYNE